MAINGGGNNASIEEAKDAERGNSTLSAHGELTETVGEAGEEHRAQCQGLVKQTEVETAEDLQAEVEQLRKRVEELTHENEELRDRWLRAVAEYQNLRRRIMSERAFAFREGKKQVLVELLNVLDDLERSLEAMKDAADLDAIKVGVELVHRQFINALNKLGVRAIPALNERFEPQYHEPVERVETDQYDEGTIVEEVQRGYMMDDLVIRPAKVKVAVAPSEKSVSESETALKGDEEG